MRRPAENPQPADLSRLRIDRGPDRGGRGRPHVRGFPWVRSLLLVALLGAAWLAREPLLSLFADEPTGLETVQVERLGTRGGGGEGRVESNGYVVARRQAALATELSGRVVSLPVEVGDRVLEKDVVARIQSDELEAGVRQATRSAAAASAQVAASRSAVEAARAQMAERVLAVAPLEAAVLELEVRAERLARDVERNRPLLEKGRLEAGAFDQIESEWQQALKSLDVAAARVAAAKGAVQSAEAEVARLEQTVLVATEQAAAATEAVAIAEARLERTFIRAPFEGIVVSKDADIGEVIAPTGAGNSSGSVVTIIDPKTLEVQVELNERRLLDVHEADRAEILLDADPENTLPARVRKVWPRADRAKGTIEIRVAFEAVPPLARPDMAARVRFLGSEPSAEEMPEAPVADRLGVPDSAVRLDGQRAFVYVVEDGRALRRTVEVDPLEGDMRPVRSGLSAGEIVLRDPPADLVDGARVEASR